MIAVFARRVLVLAQGIVLTVGGAVLVALAGGLVAAPSLGAGGIVLELGALEAKFWTPLAIASLAVGLALVALSVWPRRRVRAYGIALPSTMGDDGLVVRVAPATLINLVRYEARQINGVRDVIPEVRAEEAGWSVHCNLVVWRGRSMRDVSEQVTERVRDALHHHTGVNLANLEIDVSLAHEPVTRVE